ncbi:hypothetical protein LTR08_000077 [Meristemomyces frigidus]|nr:hypothetical protein LTR08_000077 [Meristemomyces frigidus]
MVNACATCAATFDSALDPISEKPLIPGRFLDCCGRSICSRCLNQNKRYETYCPYCQISTDPSPLLPQGLRDPPAYAALDERIVGKDDGLPAYSAHSPPVQQLSEKSGLEEPAPNVLHFVTPTDSIHALALAYGVPVTALRRVNKMFADHLLQGRRTVLIPGEHYGGGVSLSPRPLEGEEEEARKGKVRRWMVGVKCAEYDVALLYLQQAEWDLDVAMQAFREDERWEREHPIEARERAGKGKGKGVAVKSAGMRRFVGGG